MAKVSIIIPCYNAEKYLQSCFWSLERQTIGMEHLEVVFVNDASTDSTMQCLCEFEKKYPDNVIVIHCDKNGRQGAARNIGLAYATAEYVGFADDDDIFEPDMFEKMYQKAKEYDCDMVMCGFDECYDENVAMSQKKQAPLGDRFYEIATREERLALVTMGLPRGVWTKLYRRGVIASNHVCFPEGYIYDDIYFTELLKQYINRVYIMGEVYYHHIFRRQSASIDNKRKEEMLGYLDVQLMLLEELKNRAIYEDYRESYNEMLLLEAVGLVKTYLIRYGKIETDILSAVRQRIALYQDEFIKNPLLHWVWGDSSPDAKIARSLLGF